MYIFLLRSFEVNRFEHFCSILISEAEYHSKLIMHENYSINVQSNDTEIYVRTRFISQYTNI